ncbi:MAG: 3-hydroxyacyl-CoA dehydrogenase [Rhizobiales bacterium]|nr:3-hydroxyacyl-CoA dehydrogenase [Hyphomicrobiales bacterium]
MSNQAQPSTVAIVGAGSIGTGWAVVFADAGHKVRLFDTVPDRLQAARSEITERLGDLHEFDILNGTLDDVLDRISLCAELDAALAGAGHVQECIPEDLAAKKQLFAQLDGLVDPSCVLASSSSFLPASAFASDIAGRGRILVVHPANPPFLLRVVEIVPAPFTDPDVVDRTHQLMMGADMACVRLGGEVEGFAYNRLQGAVLREAYCLVRDGIVSVAEIDQLMRDALGLRWSVIGPFETSDLNTRGGIKAHAERMGPYYARMGRERGQDDPWTPQLVAEVTSARRQALPLDKWHERGIERDRALMALLRARRHDPALAICSDD